VSSVLYFEKEVDKKFGVECRVEWGDSFKILYTALGPQKPQALENKGE